MTALDLSAAVRAERRRRISYAWTIGPREADGWTPGIELLVTHDPNLRAIVVNAFRVAFRDGMVRTLWDAGASVRLFTIPCARFSARALREADALAVANLDRLADWALGVAA